MAPALPPPGASKGTRVATTGGDGRGLPPEPRQSRASNTGAAPKSWIDVSLRTSEGEALRITSSRKLQEAAIRWSYVMRNRRWNGFEAGLEDQQQRARQDLVKLGIGGEQLNKIAEAGVVEVSPWFISEAVGWETRLFPWESILTAATAGSTEREDINSDLRLR